MAQVSGGEGVAAFFRERIREFQNAGMLKVGFLAGGPAYPDGTPVAMVAAVNEFGRPAVGQPPRPFMRDTVSKYGASWPREMAGLLAANNGDATATLNQMGNVVSRQIRRTILEFSTPALAPSTIKRKGSAKPLIETELMLDSVDFEVSK